MDQGPRKGISDGIADLGFARLDTDREQRTGLAEVIWCPGKTPEHIREIARELLTHGNGAVLATRADAAAFAAIEGLSPEVRYDPVGRVIVLRASPEGAPLGHVGVITAGTADLPVAQEALTVAEALGCKASRIADIGVVGCIGRWPQPTSCARPTC
jgi:pyridinium-3,5-biscarboxylic acid mononucleotide synthase